MATNNENIRRYRRAQVRFNKTVLSLVTLVAILVLLLFALHAVGTMVTTGAKMWYISDNIRYYEAERGLALETHRGNYATECDDIIREFQADRYELLHSDNPVRAFTAAHKWYAMGIIIGFFALMGVCVNAIRTHLDETLHLFTKVIDAERLILRMIVAIVSGILMLAFGFIGFTSTRFSEGFAQVWNQSKPRRKPQHPTQENHARTKAKVINMGKRRHQKRA